MAKRPAFQFYPGDWLRDTALRSCSVSARGLWIEMICLMHEGSPYGYLRVGAKPITPAKLAQMAGASTKEVNAWLAELEDAEVFSRDDDDCIYSRRMVKDEAVRNARASGGKAGAEHGIKGAEHGKKGGRPKQDKGGNEGGLITPLPTDQNPPPASASASASAEQPPVASVVVTPNLDTHTPGEPLITLPPDWRPDLETLRGMAIRAGDDPAIVTQAAIDDFVRHWCNTGKRFNRSQWLNKALNSIRKFALFNRIPGGTSHAANQRFAAKPPLDLDDTSWGDNLDAALDIG